MESRAKLAGHAIHPMLIVFPLGLLATAVLFDLIHPFTGNAELVTFSCVARLLIGPGRTEVRRGWGITGWSLLPLAGAAATPNTLVRADTSRQPFGEPATANGGGRDR